MLTRRRAPVLCLLVLTTLLLLIYGEQPARAQTSAPAESPPTSPAQQSPRTASAPGNSQTSTTAPNSQTTATAPVASAEPDLSITARVTARELTFEVVPTPRVEFTGR